MIDKIMKIGVIGAGNISGIYLENAQKLAPIEVTAIADLRREAAEAQAEKYGVPSVLTVDEMLADEDIELVINLTNPAAHFTVARAVVAAGKSVYNEKPLTLSRAEGQILLDTASQNGVRVGGAPDTFLGAGHQTARQLIDEGAIGRPVAATAFLMSWGMEMWHPNPEFYFKTGGGPMFDMGPYYLTDLVFLLGPVTRVSGMVTTGRTRRLITSQPLAGMIIDVEVPTHVAGLLEFESGAVGTMITSFDVAGSRLPRIEIHGTEGSISVPDPNNFGGEVMLKKPGEEWRTVPLIEGFSDNGRGLGVAEMAAAIRAGRPHRANGEMAYHVVDVMFAFHESAERGEHIVIESRCERPVPFNYQKMTV